MNCVICGKELRGQQKYCCSLSCQYKQRSKRMTGKTGNKCWNWKGGKIVAHGRAYVFDPSHPNAILNKNYVQRARWLISKKLGRPLLTNEHVHHINGNKLDDRLSNLVLLTNSIHMKLHTSNPSPKTRRKFRAAYKLRRKDKYGRFISNCNSRKL